MDDGSEHRFPMASPQDMSVTSSTPCFTDESQSSVLKSSTDHPESVCMMTESVGPCSTEAHGDDAEVSSSCEMMRRPPVIASPLSAVDALANPVRRQLDSFNV